MPRIAFISIANHISRTAVVATPACHRLDRRALAIGFATHIFARRRSSAATLHERRSSRVSPDIPDLMRSSVGLTLVLVGAILVVVGLLTWAGALSWFGRLPGDIRIERTNMRVYIPLTSMLLVSVVLSVVAALIHRFR